MRALCVGIVALASTMASAQPAAVDPKAALPAEHSAKLVVGTVPVAPFIIKNADGTWSGISMDLWKEVARRLALDYEIKEMVAADLKDADKMAALDVFVSLNVSAEREAQLDLTHAFYSTDPAIYQRRRSAPSIRARVRATSSAGRFRSAAIKTPRRPSTRSRRVRSKRSSTKRRSCSTRSSSVPIQGCSSSMARSTITVTRSR